MPHNNKLIQRGLPHDIAKKDHRRWFNPHPTQSTGLWCEAGDILEIRCHYNGEAPSCAPVLWIYPITEFEDETDLKPRQSVQLNFGIQHITVKNRGIIYFATPNFPLNAKIYAEVLKGGRHMPCFVWGKDTQDTWNKALENFGDSPYGELVGQRMIVAMPLSILKKHVDSPTRVISLWDQIVSLAEECYGLRADYPRPHQATPFQYIFQTKPSSTPGGLSASNSWLGANFYAALWVCNSVDLIENGWGPWHELGHHYQLDDVNWGGMGEVTVNIVSLYVQSALNGRATRLDSIWPELFEYFKQSDRDYSKLGLFHQVAMFWQLSLVFGRDFHARLGQRYRILSQTERPKSSDEKIQRFIFECSRVSGFNLLGFFEQWGIKTSLATVDKVNNLKLSYLTKPIWKNTDENPLHQFTLHEQNISGKIVLPEAIHQNGIFDASVFVENRNSDILHYQWEIPEGFVCLTSAKSNHVTLAAPQNVIQNSSVLIRVTVRDSGGRAMTFGAKIRLKATVEKEVYPDEGADIAIMKKYNVDELHAWSDSRKGNVGDIYLGAWRDGSREYFLLKHSPYWYFPTDQKDNDDWEFLFKYTDQYCLSIPIQSDIVTKKNHLYGFLYEPISQQAFIAQVGAISISGREIDTNFTEDLFQSAGKHIVEVFDKNDPSSKTSVILEIQSPLIVKNTRVVGAAGFPMSNEMFLQKAAATTVDGSPITLTPEPAECLRQGQYLIRLSLEAHKHSTYNVVYDVISPIPINRLELSENQEWCGTEDFVPARES